MSDQIASVSEALATAPVAAQPSQLTQVEQSRAMTEVQAAMIFAQRNKRNLIFVTDLIVQDCMRIGLAEKATYTYARGGTEIEGPSIRLAEAMAQRFGNVQYGIRELEQRQGESLVQVYAWDLESNVRPEMTFTVKHVRDTKRGRVALEDTRDIYEHTANQGARRLRRCILELIPGDIVEAAMEQVNLTLRTKAEVTPERIAKVIETFKGYGVTRNQIEKRIQRRIESLTPALLIGLGKIANSLRDGMSHPSDWFEADDSGAVAPSPSPAPATGSGAASLKRRLRRNAATPSTPAPVDPLAQFAPDPPPATPEPPTVGAQATAAIVEDAKRVVKARQPKSDELKWDGEGA